MIMYYADTWPFAKIIGSQNIRVIRMTTLDTSHNFIMFHYNIVAILCFFFIYTNTAKSI